MSSHRISVLLLVATALAACGGGGGGGGGGGTSVFDPPAFLTAGVTLTALSSNIATGTLDNEVFITLNGDGSLTLDLPGGDQLTLTNNDITAIGTVPPPGGALNTTVFYDTLQGDKVRVNVGNDLAGNELYLLTQVHQFGSTLGFETVAVVGEETASMPTGTAAYGGIMVGTMFENGSLPDRDGVPGPDIEFQSISGNATIMANFDMNTVDVNFGGFQTAGAGSLTGALSGSGLPISGSRYGGTIGGTFDGNPMSGSLNGAFFGAGASATAGTFDVVDGTGTVEVVGGFGAFKTTP